MKKRTYEELGGIVNEYVYSKEYASIFGYYRLGYIDGMGMAVGTIDLSPNIYNSNIEYYSGFEDGVKWMDFPDEILTLDLYNKLVNDLDEEYEKFISKNFNK